jgi:alpha-L-arabinofuranosidase
MVMKFKPFVPACLLLALCFLFNCQNSLNAMPQESTSNPVKNPSFEQAGRNNRPADWRPATWGGTAQFEYAEIGHTGSRSVLISSDEGADAGWFSMVPIEPYAHYIFSGWIKTENLTVKDGRGASFNFHDSENTTKPLTGTNDWTKVEFEFDSGDNDGVQLNCLFGGWGLATGKAWYDDINFELLSKKDVKPTASIDISKKSQPISKYIYGQFIEHLGRCIYGGVWAEMLEDRKFYYPVNRLYDAQADTDPNRESFNPIRNSPWKIIGLEDAVKMINENAYVGEHTPQFTLTGDGKPAGIIQNRLGLVAGKEYVGRVVLAGDAEIAPVKVSLVWGPNPTDRQTVTIAKITSDFAKYPFTFKAGASTINGKLEIVAAGKGTYKIGTVSIMPGDNINGMRADTMKLLKELNAPVYRWPGGNFVSGYDWRDGIDPDRDRRPPRKNPAWTGIEHNDFGIHEYIAFCRYLNTDPMIAVNTGLGKIEEAAKEVEYTNGSPDTEMGKLRAKNGSREPFNVKFWCVGNEMYGSWQLGNMPVADYANKHNDCAKAMWAVDKSIKLVAVGDTGTRGWNNMILGQCADYMNYLSEHFYCQERAGLLSHIAWIAESIKGKCDAHREYRKTIKSLEGKDIRISMDEWNYWYGPHVFGELGTRYFLKDGLGIAKGLHEFFRNTDIVSMANYAQTVNVIGCIKTTRTAAAFETTGLVLKMYRNNFGTIPVEVGDNPKPLDVSAALTDDGKKLTVGIVNPTKREITLPINFKNVKLTGSGKLLLMAGDDPQAYNQPGEKPKIEIVEKTVSSVSDKLVLPPLSDSLYILDIK